MNGTLRPFSSSFGSFKDFWPSPFGNFTSNSSTNDSGYQVRTFGNIPYANITSLQEKIGYTVGDANGSLGKRPPSVIPNVSQGTFRLAMSNSTLPQLTAFLGANGFGWLGCNAVAVLVTVGTNNSLQVSSSSSGDTTNTTCHFNND
jgi:hypothetical protein